MPGGWHDPANAAMLPSGPDHSSRLVTASAGGLWRARRPGRPMTDAATRTGDVRPGDTIVLLADSPESADGPTDVLRLVHVDEA